MSHLFPFVGSHQGEWWLLVVAGGSSSFVSGCLHFCCVANGHMALASCVRKGEGGGVRLLTWTSSLTLVLRSSLSCVVVVCALLVAMPASCVKKGTGEGVSLTCINVDSDDACCHHRLDDMACPLMCYVVTVLHCCSSIGMVTLHCHGVVVVVCIGASTDSCGGWRFLVAVVTGCGFVGVGGGGV
jgi:hypothetical protein